MALQEVAIEGRGRGMVAVRAVQGGEVLLQESPLLLYEEEDAAESSSFCGHCMISFWPGLSRTPCPSCATTFCSSSCLHSAQHSSHTPRVCKALSVLSTSELSSEDRTLARFLIAAYNLSLEDPKAFEILMQLEGLQYVDDTVRELHEFCLEALQGSDLDPMGFSVDMTGGLLAKDARNAFGLMAPSREDGGRKVRGCAIYAKASMFNHDCLPNACRFEYIDKGGDGNTDVFIRALHDIEEGTEICLSYFPIDWPYGDRKKKLEEEYEFQCRCERCKVESQWKDDEDEEEAEAQQSAMERKSNDKGDDGDEDDDFVHAMFFVKYLCPVEECGGTMAPLQPGELDKEGLKCSMECNYCGNLRSQEEFLRDLEEHKLIND